MLHPAARRIATALIATVGAVLMTSCSLVSGWFGDDDPAKPVMVSVFDVQVGDCLLAPEEVKAELPDLGRVPCDIPHQQELYAKITYVADGVAAHDDPYPGADALDTFAQGGCAQEFPGYVGLDYPDSGLWMTYLLPSARSWQQGEDRAVLCFVTTTGQSLTQSVKGSKL